MVSQRRLVQGTDSNHQKRQSDIVAVNVELNVNDRLSVRMHRSSH
jgi:hypothetical protein